MLLPLTAARSSIFLSTPSARRATHPALRRHRILRISIHALREEGDLLTCCSRSSRQCISIHALREEGDAKATEIEVEILNFYPRPPRGGRRVSGCEHHNLGRFLSTPSARRATGQHGGALRNHDISIHALREEGDIAVQHILERDANFYPRPPRGGRHLLSTALGTPTDFYPRPPRGGRRISPSLARDSRTFLSTPSARRATQHQHRKRLCWCISIHALREEGDLHPLFLDAIISDISIHALREEGDTGFGRLCCCGFPISIHALREEGDAQRGWSKTTPKYFYPRPPRGGRLVHPFRGAFGFDFYPRPPRGGRRSSA